MVALLATCYLLPILWYFLLDESLEFIFISRLRVGKVLIIAKNLGFPGLGYTTRNSLTI